MSDEFGELFKTFDAEYKRVRTRVASELEKNQVLQHNNEKLTLENKILQERNFNLPWIVSHVTLKLLQYNRILFLERKNLMML